MFVLLAASLLPAQLPDGWNDLGSEFQEGLTQPWYLEPLPELELTEAHTPRHEDIEAMIDALVDVDAPGYGYSATMSGVCFLPWPDQRTFGSGLLMQRGHWLEAAPALAWLERLGPHALPYLLAHLKDRRETRLTFGPEDRFGALWLERRIEGNPLNEHETRALGEHVFPRWFRGGMRDHEVAYTLTVGDLCLVALGQIVNRPSYAAARYQGSGHVVITSPAHDPWLATALRDIWGFGDPRDGVLRSLLLDLHTRGQGTDRLQAGAAMRLAYYFPRESAALLVRRIDGLHVGLDEGPFYDGVRAEEFLDALSPCGFPPIAAAVRRARTRSGTKPEIEAYLGDDPSPRRMLRAAWREGGQAARLAFEQALEPDEVGAKALACRTLSLAPGDRSGMLAALRSLLEDERATGERYVAEDEGWLANNTLGAFYEEGEDGDIRADIRARIEDLYSTEIEPLAWNEECDPEPIFQGRRYPLRVCDEAARAVASILEAATFVLEGNHAALDAQRRALIADLDRALGR